MSKSQNKRQLLFDKYKDNLNLLIDNGFISDYQKEVYVCPICLTCHDSLDSKDPLTLEDAPPKSLGGTANTLTCKSCNNKAGHKIDFHLTERLREIDSAKFVPGTKTSVKVNINGDTFQGSVAVEEDGKIKIFHSPKNNNPGELEKTMHELKSGMVIDINFLKSRVIPENLEYALLKTGYLMAFERFGYSLILHPCFDIVRDQLKSPEQRIYPEGFWFCPPYPKSMSGVYFICDKGTECLVAMFNLDTGNTERMFGVLLPLPIRPIEETIANLNKKFEKEGAEISLTLYPLEQDKMDYINNIDEIKAMYAWIEERRKRVN